ncbi:hypothetical protein MBLNU230_g3080t1 [Neophaeotheca triangularis]
MTLRNILALWFFSGAGTLAHPNRLEKRLDNGLAQTPIMGWNSYNVYNCQPNQSVVQSNAQALVDLGLADLGYYYVTTDCGWTLPERNDDGTLPSNPQRFPDTLPVLGEFIHSLGLGFGVYSNLGIKMCMTGEPSQNGSLGYEELDANTFASWGADILKIDNCFSSEERGYPNVDYYPLTSPRHRFEAFRDTLNATGRPMVYQVCEWGLDFPSEWAPDVGNSWRISNDIVSEFRSVYMIANQFVPSSSYSAPGQWADLDMLLVGNQVFTEAEEQTHFSLWAIAKSTLYIGCALNDTFTSIPDFSLDILKNTHAIGYNQDSLGVAASLARRYSDQGLDVWTGPLSGDRTVVAFVNWKNETVHGTFYLPDAGIQSAGSLYDVWNDVTVSDVLTSYSAEIQAHGTILMELSDTNPAGTYSIERFGIQSNDSITFGNVYGITGSERYTLSVYFGEQGPSPEGIDISTSASDTVIHVMCPAGSDHIKAPISLAAGANNTISISGDTTISSIQISQPQGTFYPSTDFVVSGGNATHITCVEGRCQPVGSKIAGLSQNGSASLTVPGTHPGPRYVELTYINNEVPKDTGWTNGTATRNITVAVNGAQHVRLDAPLSGRSSELYSPMHGWGDPATLGLLVDGWGPGDGEDTIVVGNANGDAGVQPYGANFVGLRVF